MLQKAVGIIVATVLCSGCATAEPSLKISRRDVSGAYCAPLFSVSSMTSHVSPLSGGSSGADEPSAFERLSPESRQIAEVIGVTDLIRETMLLEAGNAELSEEVKHRLVEARQHLSDHLVAIFFEVGSVAARVDCEATRANHVAAALTEIHDRRARRYEITAIVGDALIGIVGGAFTLAAKETAAGIADVIGGTFATSFGLAAGLTGAKNEFFHAEKTNLLRELWEAPQEPTLFPASVWRFLNWNLGPDAEYKTRRDELIAEWRNDGLIAEADPLDRRAALFFGSGGNYDVDDLRARSQMLEVIKTSLSVMMQYLYLLSHEVLNEQRFAAR